ncbi:hypothetical protein ACFYUY_27780 [Kitasatospora sp. NPDC004745]|uniref:hypothetical protein n=1 Tax=Kitasatospora sp. NPDC004745 TaxID=3364019 RepID=UPI0036C8A8A9
MTGVRRVQVLVVGAGRAVLAAGHHLRHAGPALASVPAGRIADRLGARSPVLVLAAGVAALAPKDLRGSALGLLATAQSLGDLAASTVAGILWTAVSPSAAFAYLAAWMVLALAGLGTAARR